jgi:hypothetical protein
VTAVLAAARAVAYGLLGAALVLVCVVAMIWPYAGPQGLWTVAWVGTAGVTVAGSGAALTWLGERRRGGTR